MNTRPTFRFLRLTLGVFLLCTMTLGVVRPAYADALRCYVKADAAGSNTGGSWENAYTDLQSALGASPCTEVWVAGGTYVPTTGTDRAISFVLKTGVAIYGGFAGGETLLSQRNLVANPTILSGDIGVAGDATDNRPASPTSTGCSAACGSTARSGTWSTSTSGTAVSRP